MSEPQFDTPAIPTVPAVKKDRPVPRSIRAAVTAIEDGRAKNWTQAARVVGISREYLARMRAKEHIQAFIDHRTRQSLAAGKLRAARRLVDLVDCGSLKTSLDAAKHLLGIGGIAPAPTSSLNVNIELKAGYVIDLSGPGLPEQKIISGQVIDEPIEPVRVHGIGSDHHRKD